jgi:FkbM family methyltransferase
VQSQLFNISYSQEGEDMILRRLFEDRRRGYYVDVGAHHPKRFSNTFTFYKKGWRGINIDAMPGSMAPFKRIRPRDVNLEVAIAEESRRATYFMFNDPALNTFDQDLARSRDGVGQFRIVRQQEISMLPLSAVLEKHLPSGQSITFLSVDVEGFDALVLRSNDWKRFRPECVLIESGQPTIADTLRDESSVFLQQHGYQLIAKTVSTAIFRNEKDRGNDA